MLVSVELLRIKGLQWKWNRFPRDWFQTVLTYLFYHGEDLNEYKRFELRFIAKGDYSLNRAFKAFKDIYRCHKGFSLYHQNRLTICVEDILCVALFIEHSWPNAGKDLN